MASSGQFPQCTWNNCPEPKNRATPQSKTSNCSYEPYQTYSTIYLSKHDKGSAHQPVYCTALAQKSGVQVETYAYGTVTFAKKVKNYFSTWNIILMVRLIMNHLLVFMYSKIDEMAA